MKRRPTCAIQGGMTLLRIGLAALVVAGCSGRAEAPAGPTARVAMHPVQIVAADMFRDGSQTYRLANALVPQPFPAAKCWAEAALAATALSQVRIFTADAVSREDIEAVGNDADGAIRATVKVAGADVGETLVGEGLAVRWTNGWDWCAAHPNPTDARGPYLGPRLVVLGVAR